MKRDRLRHLGIPVQSVPNEARDDQKCGLHGVARGLDLFYGLGKEEAKDAGNVLLYIKIHNLLWRFQIRVPNPKRQKQAQAGACGVEDEDIVQSEHVYI